MSNININCFVSVFKRLLLFLLTGFKRLRDVYKKYFEILNPVVVLAAICLVVALALSVCNLFTIDKITAIEKEKTEAAMKSLISADEYKEIDVHSILLPDADYSVATYDGLTLYLAYSGEDFKGYIVTTRTKGYGGEISVMTAINNDKKILGVNILSCADETPGLGQNISKENFYSQYAGKTKDIVVVKNSAKGENNEINAVTGATISSKAVTAAINEAFIWVENYDAYMLLNSEPNPEITDETVTESETEEVAQ